VQISSTTPGAEIRYTTDGNDPTIASPVYTQPIDVAQSLVLKAIATAPNYEPSQISTASYTIDLGSKAATPTISPNGGTFCAPYTVTLATSEPNGVVRYTTDGTAPTASSTLYTAPLFFNTSTSIFASTFAPGKAASDIAMAWFTLHIGCSQVEPVIITPGSQTSYNDVSVTLTCITPGAAICYTLDGAIPTCAGNGACQSGNTYAGTPVLVDQTGITLTARGCMSGIDPSALSNAIYSLEVGPVSFDPAPGTVASGTALAFSTVTSDAMIRYRTDGVDPTCDVGELFDAFGPPLVLTQDTDYRVIACKPGYASTAVALGSYTVVP